MRQKARQLGLANVRAEVRDFVLQDTGLPAQSADHIMIYNLLHIEEPVRLLAEAHRVLKPGGVVSIIHWKHEPATTARRPPAEKAVTPAHAVRAFLFTHYLPV